MSVTMPKEWLKAARLDCIVLEEIIHNEHLTAMIAFHSQQTVEKSLKALLEYKKHTIHKVHSLNKLVNECEKYIKVNNDLIINKLDKLYIDSRYPGDMGLLPYGKPTMEDAKEFYDFAHALFDEVCRLLDIDIDKETK